MMFTYQSTSVQLPANRFNNQYPGFKHQVETLTATDGSVVAYSGAYEEMFINIRLHLKESQRLALRAFFMDAVHWSTLEFQMTPDLGIDLGNGAGQPLYVRLWQDTYAEVPIAYGVWEVAFVLRGLVPPSGGGS